MNIKEKYSGMSEEELQNHLQTINEVLESKKEIPFIEYSTEDKLEYLHNYFKSIGIPEIYNFGDVYNNKINKFYGIRYDVSRAKDIEYMNSIFNKNIVELFKFAKGFKDIYSLIILKRLDTPFNNYSQIELYDSLKDRNYLIGVTDELGKRLITDVTINTGNFISYDYDNTILEFYENGKFGESLEFEVRFDDDNIEINDELAPKKIMDKIHKEFRELKDEIIKRLEEL